MSMKLLSFIAAILFPLVALAQPVGEVDPHSIHTDGTSTTTAPIHFNKMIDVVASTCTWCSEPGMYPDFITFWPSEGPDAPDYYNYVGSISSWEDYPTAGQNTLAMQCLTGKLYLYGAAGTDIKGGNAITEGTNPLRLYGNAAINVGSYGSDVRLTGGLSFGGGAYPERSGVVAILGNSDSIPSEVRGNYNFYVKGDAWVDGKITADDFIVAPDNQALIMRGGTNEPVIIQLATPVATPAYATNPNDLFVEGKSEFASGAVMPVGKSLYLESPMGVDSARVANIDSNPPTLVLEGSNQTALRAAGSVALYAGSASYDYGGAGGDVLLSPGAGWAGGGGNVKAEGGLENDGITHGWGVLVGIDVTPNADTGRNRGSVIVQDDLEVQSDTLLKGLTGPGMLKIGSNEAISVATPATDYIATELDPNAVLANGTRALSADWDAGGYEIRTKTIEIDDTASGGVLAYFSGLGSKIMDYGNAWLNISGSGTADSGTDILIPKADTGGGFWVGFANQNSPIQMGSAGDELEVGAGPYGEVSVGYGLKATSGYTAVTASTCAAWDSNRKLISGTLQPTPTPITTGNLTASSPIAVSATRQVVGGAAQISHATTAGNKHVPTSGSTGQILRNTGVSGTAGWGTVTESSGALANVTSITQSGNLTQNADRTKIIQGAGSDVEMTYDGTDWFFTIAQATSSVIWNESGLNTDFRIEGDTERNLFFLDAGRDAIGLGNDSPAYRLDVTGDIRLSADLFATSDSSEIVFGAGEDAKITYDGTNWLFNIAQTTGSVIFNESGADTNFRVEGDTDANLLTLDAGLDRAGIGVASPTSKLDVNGDVELASGGAVYFGDPTTNDSWRIVRSGNNLVFERREADAWVTKDTITP